MLDVRHANSPCHKVHAVKLLNHVPLNASRLIKHVARQLKSLTSTRYPRDSKYKAFMVGLISNLIVGAALKPVEDFGDMERRNVKLKCDLSDRAPIDALMLLGMLQVRFNERLSLCELVRFGSMKPNSDRARKHSLKLEEPLVVAKLLKGVEHGHDDFAFKVQARCQLLDIDEQVHVVTAFEFLKLVQLDEG